MLTSGAILVIHDHGLFWNVCPGCLFEKTIARMDDLDDTCIQLYRNKMILWIHQDDHDHG
jgi:hypothetical protein